MKTPALAVYLKGGPTTFVRFYFDVKRKGRWSVLPTSFREGAWYRYNSAMIFIPHRYARMFFEGFLPWQMFVVKSAKEDPWMSMFINSVNKYPLYNVPGSVASVARLFVHHLLRDGFRKAPIDDVFWIHPHTFDFTEPCLPYVFYSLSCGTMYNFLSAPVPVIYFDEPLHEMARLYAISGRPVAEKPELADVTIWASEMRGALKMRDRFFTTNKNFRLNLPMSIPISPYPRENYLWVTPPVAALLKEQKYLPLPTKPYVLCVVATETEARAWADRWTAEYSSTHFGFVAVIPEACSTYAKEIDHDVWVIYHNPRENYPGFRSPVVILAVGDGVSAGMSIFLWHHTGLPLIWLDKPEDGNPLRKSSTYLSEEAILAAIMEEIAVTEKPLISPLYSASAMWRILLYFSRWGGLVWGTQDLT